tara:strand:- start:208 stop:585 length:378 start_codon:yes stop_codon:yes gene_type:complete
MAFKMKGFKPHNMYKTEKAETNKEHLALKEKGYDHSPYNKYKSDAQRKAVHASKAESALKKPLVGDQDQLPENLKQKILDTPMKKYGKSPMKKAKGIDGKACWKGYKLQGTKMKGGKRVDNCVKM